MLMLGELVATIAHEVSQPLAGLILDAEAALRWLASPDPDQDELRAIAQRSAVQARRAMDILTRIRDMARPADPIREAVDVNAVVIDAMAFVRDELSRRGIDTELDLVDALRPVAGDKIQLQQVVVNLVLNAVQAMSRRPHAAKRLRLTSRGCALGGVIVCVDDTGSGVPVADRPRLFDSFFSTKSGGMGMGLYICRTIVVEHGGDIGIGDAPTGWSTRFVVRLPPGIGSADDR